MQLSAKRKSRKKTVHSALVGPDGSVFVGTDTQFFASWKDFSDKLQQALVAEVVGFGDKVMMKDAETGQVFTLPLCIAQRVVALWEKTELSLLMPGETA